MVRLFSVSFKTWIQSKHPILPCALCFVCFASSHFFLPLVCACMCCCTEMNLSEACTWVLMSHGVLLQNLERHPGCYGLRNSLNSSAFESLRRKDEAQVSWLNQPDAEEDQHIPGEGWGDTNAPRTQPVWVTFRKHSLINHIWTATTIHREWVVHSGPLTCVRVYGEWKRNPAQGVFICFIDEVYRVRRMACIHSEDDHSKNYDQV